MNPPENSRPKPAAKTGILAEATASLTPFPTRFAHRPDWQAAADDEADGRRESGRGG